MEKAQQKLEEIDRAEYTEASLKELEDAILAAGQEVEKDDTTEARLQELLDALLAVELVTKLDEKKAELDAAVKAKEAELAEINREEYTASSIRALETAIAEAKAELNKTDTTVAALTEKLEALDVTLERKDPNLPAKKEELQTEIEKAEQKLAKGSVYGSFCSGIRSGNRGSESGTGQRGNDNGDTAREEGSVKRDVRAKRCGSVCGKRRLGNSYNGTGRMARRN